MKSFNYKPLQKVQIRFKKFIKFKHYVFLGFQVRHLQITDIKTAKKADIKIEWDKNKLFQTEQEIADYKKELIKQIPVEYEINFVVTSKTKKVKV